MNALLVAALVALASLGYGCCLLRLARPGEGTGPLAALLLSFGLGSGTLSLAMLALGLLGGLYLGPVMFVLVGGLALGVAGGLRSLTGLAGALPGKLRSARVKGLPFGQVGAVAAIAGLALLNALAALAPVLDGDALAYHLAVPHIYLQQHRIAPIPSIPFSYLPLGVQMLYLPCLALGSGPAAQLLHVLFGLASAGVVACLARRFYGARTAALAALLFYSLTDVSAETALARVDLAVTFYALLAFLYYTLARGRARWLVLAGVFAGLSAGSKYTGLVVPLLLTVVAFFGWTGEHRGTEGNGERALFAVTLPALLVAAPWYLRNLAWTGNPCFPAFTTLLGRGPLVPEQSAWLQQSTWSYAPIARTLANFLLVPVLLVFRHGAFASGRIGPLFLVYLPLFIAVRWRRLGRLVPLFAFSLLWLPFWFWTSPLVRFLLAPLGLLCIPLARALRLALRYDYAARARERSGRGGQGWNRLLRGLTACLLILWLAFAAASNVKNHAPLVPAGLGLMPPEAFLEQAGLIEGYRYADLRYVNRDLQPRSLLVFGSHGLYLERPFALAGDLALAHWPAVRRGDLDAIEAALRARGITHILFREGWQDPHDV